MGRERESVLIALPTAMSAVYREKDEGIGREALLTSSPVMADE